MKKLLFSVISCFSLTSLASEKMDMTCVTEFPTTSFVIREIGDRVNVQVIHHNGSQYMPIFDGLATPHDLTTLAARAKVLTSLPTHQTFEWPRTKCEIQEEMIQTCMGSTDTQELNGHQVSAWSLSSSWSTEKTAYGKFNSRKVNLNITVDGQSYSIPMKYSEEECTPYSFTALQPNRNHSMR